MNIDQVQRRDIDELGVNTISLAIDELSNVDESFISLLTSNLSANNWYSDDGSLAKDMVTNDDKLVFNLEPQTDWKYKNIVEIKLVGNIYSSDLISLESIGINQYFTSLDFPINQSTDVDVSLDISSISQEDLNSLIVDKGFDIVLNFNGNKTNANVSIIELQAVFVFDDKLQGEKEAIMNRIGDLIYPVGSIYMSVNNVNPELLFGGSWEKIEDSFLLGSGSYNLGDTGGSKDAVVVSHTHSPGTGRAFLTAPSGSEWAEYAGGSISGSGRHYVGTSDSDNYNVYVSGSGSAGTSGTDKNMPPYFVVNMWKRTG